MTSPIDWGQIVTRSSNPKRKRKLHLCSVKDCVRKTTGKYCSNHMAMLHEQVRVEKDSPSLRQLREANQARLKRERGT